MATIKPISVPAKRLAQTITGSASSFKLDNILGWDGVTNLAASDFGTKAYAAFRNSAGTLIEFMEIDPSTIASASITILYRGLAYNGDNLTTEVAANKLTWVKGDTIVELGTHMPQLLAHYVDIVSAQTIAGVKTYSDFPVKSGSTTPTVSTQFATKAYVDAVGTGTAVYDQNVITGVAGENLVAGNWVYFKASDGKWWKTDSDAAATAVGVRLGVAQATILADATGNILIGGLEKNQSTLVAGTHYYLSGTAAGISSTPGTFKRYVGQAVSTTEILFAGDLDIFNQKQNGQTIFAVDSVGTDSYAVTLVPAPTALENGMVIHFKAGTTNTGAASLAVNGIAAKTIKKNYDQTLANSDIKAGQLVTVIYDSSNDCFQMQSALGNVSVVPKFGGDGSDGALTLTSGATNIDCGGANLVVKQYSSISITGTGQLTFSNPATDGTIIILKSQGAVTLTSATIPNIDASGMGAAGGTGGTGGAAPTDGTAGTLAIGAFDDSATHMGGGGAKGVDGGVATAGTAGAVYTNLQMYTRTAAKLARRTFGIAPGSGGGGGGGGIAASGITGNGGDGGRGGGGLIIECAGALNFTSALGISVAGDDGVAGGTAAGGTALKAAGGGGGGGAGGFCIVLYNTLTAASGTVNTAGGAGGVGGDATATSSDGSGGTCGSGAGGGGGGAYAAGGAGGAGVAQNTAGNAGGGGGSTRGGGGGGSGGAKNKNDTTARLGGAAGAAGASENVLVAQNYYFV